MKRGEGVTRSLLKPGATALSRAWQCIRTFDLRFSPLPIALLIAATGLAYSNTFGNEFVLDDYLTIIDNPTIRALWPPGLFQSARIDDPYLQQIVHVRPIPNFLFALNYAVSGTAPWSYHAVNLLLHMCSTLLLFAILRRTLLTMPLVERFGRAASSLAFTGALLWSLHPLLTNAVTYIMPRMELTMALFYLATLYAWIRGVQDGSRRWLALSVGACVMGMMSKQVMVTAPFMVLLYDGLFLAGSWREAVRRRWAWYCGLLLSVVWLIFLIERVPGGEGLFGSPTAPGDNQRGAQSDRWSYAATMPGVILHYLRLIVWPDPLILDYKWPVAATLPSILVPGAVLATGMGATVWGLLRRQTWAYSFAWFFVTLAPSSSLMPLYDDYACEFRVYLPSIGPVVLAVCLAWQALSRNAGITAFQIRTFVAVLALLLGTLTLVRNADYRTAVSIWSDNVRKAPDNARAYAALGIALHRAHRDDEALPAFREAIRLFPDDGSSRNDIGAILINQGRLGEAVDWFEDMVQRLPNFVLPHRNLGAAYQAQGRFDKAAAAYRRALSLEPTAAADYFKLAATLKRLGENDEAVEAYRQGLRYDPSNARAHNDLGSLYQLQGKLPEAASEFRRALELDPATLYAYYNLASVLEKLGRHDEAAEVLRQGMRSGLRDTDTHVLMGNILTELRRLEDAIAEYRQALVIDPGNIVARNNIRVLETGKEAGK